MELGYIPSQFMPKTHCPFETFTIDEDGWISKPIPCKGKMETNGWCKEHQRSLEPLRLGAVIGYPRLQINRYLWVGEGKPHWEGLAMRLTSHRLEGWIQVVTLRANARKKE